MPTLTEVLEWRRGQSRWQGIHARLTNYPTEQTTKEDRGGHSGSSRPCRGQG
jgi:hypothetical protein